MQIFQWIIMISAFLLLMIGILMTHSEARKWVESLISTLLISSMTSMMFPLMFLWIAELFPTNIRGLATAVILFLGKLLGGFAPLLSDLCERNSIHVLVGCSTIGILSLIATSYMRETYEAETDEEKSIAKIKQ